LGQIIVLDKQLDVGKVLYASMLKMVYIYIYGYYHFYHNRTRIASVVIGLGLMLSSDVRAVPITQPGNYTAMKKILI
jgi:hypothetical protein